MNPVLSFTLLNDRARQPVRGSDCSAGWDLSVAIDKPMAVEPQTHVLLPTGIQVHFPPGFYGQLFARSGMVVRTGYVILAGVIDEDYKGEIKVALLNPTNKPFIIQPRQRVAQMVVLPYYKGQVCISRGEASGEINDNARTDTDLMRERDSDKDSRGISLARSEAHVRSGIRGCRGFGSSGMF